MLIDCSIFVCSYLAQRARARIVAWLIASPLSWRLMATTPVRGGEVVAASPGASGSVFSESPMGAASTSGSTDRFGQGKLSSAAQRVPRPAKTGNPVDDDQLDAIYHTTVQLVNEIVKAPSFCHTLPLWKKLQERNRAMAAGEFVSGERFRKRYKSLGALMHEETEWAIAFLCHVSGLEAKDFVLAQKREPDALERLIIAETTLLPSLVLPGWMMSKAILWKLMNGLSQRAGRRCKTRAASLIDAETGAIDWPSLVYELTYAEDVLQKVQHTSSGHVVDVSKLKITKSYKLYMPWHDYSAELVQPPMAPTKICQFFGKAEGPNSTKDPTKATVWADLCKDARDEYNDDLRKKTLRALRPSTWLRSASLSRRRRQMLSRAWRPCVQRPSSSAQKKKARRAFQG